MATQQAPAQIEAGSRVRPRWAIGQGGSRTEYSVIRVLSGFGSHLLLDDGRTVLADSYRAVSK